MKKIIIDSSGMENKVLSEFCSELGFKVEALDRMSDRTSALNDGDASPCVVILGISKIQNIGQLQLAEAVSAYPGTPIIVLADRTFCVDARSPYIDAVQAIVRRPMQIEEIEWILRRLSGIKQI